MKIVAVMSPKGGVGKTTISINIAFALKRRGRKVGILDIDYHGPTLPVLLFRSWKLPRIEVRDLVKPVEYNGVKIFSLAFIADPSEVCMWSGETALQYTRALFSDIDWGDVDWVIVDTPPGLWDSNVEILARADKVVVVTEPTLVSIYDAKKLVAATKRKLAAVVVNEAREYADKLSIENVREILGVDSIYWVPFNKQLQKDPTLPLRPIEELVEKILGRDYGSKA